MHENFYKKHNTNMTKINFFILSFFIFMTLFVAVILPYPIFSKYTNLSATQMSQIQDYFETEITNDKEEKITMLALPWKIIDSLLASDYPYEIVDLNSGQTFNIVRIGGKNHADILPLNKTDQEVISSVQTENKKFIPALVRITPNTYLPAAFCPYAHGYKNHYCLHFIGSKTTGTNMENQNAQSCVNYARKHGLELIKEFI